MSPYSVSAEVSKFSSRAIPCRAVVPNPWAAAHYWAVTRSELGRGSGGQAHTNAFSFTWAHSSGAWECAQVYLCEWGACVSAAYANGAAYMHLPVTHPRAIPSPPH